MTIYETRPPIPRRRNMSEVMFWAFNPLVWLAVYVMYRVLFTNPGRPPIHEGCDE